MGTKHGARLPSGPRSGNLGKKKDRSEANEISELITKADNLGLKAEDFTEEIEYLKEQEASDINGSLSRQIRYIYECEGKEGAGESIKRACTKRAWKAHEGKETDGQKSQSTR